MSGYQTFETKTGSKPVLYEPDVRKPDINVRFSNECLKSGHLGTGQDLKTPKSGRPDFGALL